MTRHDPTEDDPQLVGSSAAMEAVRRSIDAVARHKHTVVVTGETGTGKEVVAAMIHRRSGRAGPMVAVNCSTLSESLLASDLFGHVRGAFTGAVADHPGLFRAARGGTLLLDELADLPLGLQAALLRVLETRQVRPVGGTADIGVDVRVVATTNRDLMTLVREGRFRADLYARLAQWTIRLPPLRDRREDIVPIALHLLRTLDAGGCAIAPDLAEALRVHDWPLNVRGLLNVMSIAALWAEGRGELSLTPDVADALASTGRITPEPRVDASLGKAELEDLMVQFRGKVAAGARHLGITRPKLYRMLWAHEIDPRVYRRP